MSTPVYIDEEDEIIYCSGRKKPLQKTISIRDSMHILLEVSHHYRVLASFPKRLIDVVVETVMYYFGYGIVGAYTCTPFSL